MLTKQDREEIVKRVKDELDRDYVDCADFCEAITGKGVSIGKPFDYYNRMIFSVILDLCDTSDMVELPIDKDGIPIRIGDTVWCNGEKETVKAIEIRDSEARIHFVMPIGCESWSSPELITHAEPISEYERIAQEIEEIAAANKGSVTEQDLLLVAEEIRELGDDND